MNLIEGNECAEEMPNVEFDSVVFSHGDPLVGGRHRRYRWCNEPLRVAGGLPWRVLGLGLLLGLILLACGGRTVEPCVGNCIPIPSGDRTLAAELELPAGLGPHPVLVMIHGSGRGTRHDFAGVVDTYRSIGVGILRFDKRGVGESTGRFRDVTAANSIEVFDLLAADVLAVIEHLATQPRCRLRADRPDRRQPGWLDYAPRRFAIRRYRLLHQPFGRRQYRGSI